EGAREEVRLRPEVAALQLPGRGEVVAPVRRLRAEAELELDRPERPRALDVGGVDALVEDEAVGEGGVDGVRPAHALHVVAGGGAAADAVLEDEVVVLPAEGGLRARFEE